MLLLSYWCRFVFFSKTFHIRFARPVCTLNQSPAEPIYSISKASHFFKLETSVSLLLREHCVILCSNFDCFNLGATSTFLSHALFVTLHRCSSATWVIEMVYPLLQPTATLIRQCLWIQRSLDDTLRGSGGFGSTGVSEVHMDSFGWDGAASSQTFAKMLALYRLRWKSSVLRLENSDTTYLSFFNAAYWITFGTATNAKICCTQDSQPVPVPSAKDCQFSLSPSDPSKNVEPQKPSAVPQREEMLVKRVNPSAVLPIRGSVAAWME